MPVNVKTMPSTGSGFRQPPLEAGTYPARTVRVVYYGLQNQQPFNGQEKEPRCEVGITYELLDEFCVDEDGNIEEDRPRWLSEHFAVFNLEADRAKSTIRYKALDPKEEFDGDFLQLVDIPCMITITETEGKGKNAGRVFNNISNVSTMRPKQAATANELINEPVVFDVEEPTEEGWLKLNRFEQQKLKDNLEFAGSALEDVIDNLPEEEEEEEAKPKPTSAKKKAAPKKAVKAKKEPVEDEEEDDIPW